MCKKLIIVGASGHGKVIADIARLNGYEEIKFLDDDINKTYNGKYEVIGITDDIDKYVDEYFGNLSEDLGGITDEDADKMIEVVEKFYIVMSNRK